MATWMQTEMAAYTSWTLLNELLRVIPSVRDVVAVSLGCTASDRGGLASFYYCQTPKNHYASDEADQPH